MSATGNVRSSQLRSGDRTGNGSRIVSAASGTLTQNVPLLYDANGNVVATGTRTGNTTNFATATAGSKTSGNYPKWDADGNLTNGDAGGGGGVAVGPNTQTLVPVVNGDFSDLNSPSVVSTIGNSLYIASTTTGSDNMRGRIKAVPSAPYTVEVGFFPDFRHENYRFAGMCLYDGTKLKLWGIKNTTGLAYDDWNSVTSINAGTNWGNPFYTGPLFLKLVDDNTNWKWYVGLALDQMELLVTQARNTFLTPTHVGMCVNNNVGTGRVAGWYFHWRQY